MTNWIEKFKQLVYSSQFPRVILQDVDGIMDYPELTEILEVDGYTIHRAKTELELRFVYELYFRGKDANQILVIPSTYSPLPDIGIEVHLVNVGLRQLFPNLESKVLRGLSFNALSLLGNIRTFEELGEERSLRFVLENLYNADLNTLKGIYSKERTLSLLISVFFHRELPNQPIVNCLSLLARQHFKDLADGGISKGILLDYLKKVWYEFAIGKISPVDFLEPTLMQNLMVLFIKGDLSSVLVSAELYHTIPPALSIGVHYDSQEALRNEITALLSYLNEKGKSIQDIPEEWFGLAPIAGKAMFKALILGDTSILGEVNKTIEYLNTRFQIFIDNTYFSLFSRSGVKWPVVVTKILDYIKVQPGNRHALIVIDGMNYWQWEILAEQLKASDNEITEGAVFAYVPSITAWSRQAIFRGGKPDLSTNNAQEASMYRFYWQQNRVADFQIAYARFGTNEHFEADNVSNAIRHLALVCNDLDDMMHGTIMGNEQLYDSTKRWIERSNILSIIQSLKIQGFNCYVTTDHGNVEALGVGNLKLSEKVGALSRGKRHLKFSNSTLLQHFREQNGALRYGVVENSVYLKDTSAFTDSKTKVVTHGGSHFWEVIIPFVQL